MKLDIGELLHQPGMVNYDVNQPCPADLGMECAGPVTGLLQFSSTGNLLLIRGGLDATVRVQCDRCLEEFTLPVHADVEEEFRIRPGEILASVDEEEDSPGSDETVVALFDGVNLKLDELIRQHILLAIPPFKVCDDACKGLCAQCGQNLNQAQCGCSPDLTASPFAALADRMGRAS